jgi:outer membrane protein OmpU
MKMKKILLCSAAVAGVAFAAAPAMAQVDVTVGGHTKNYIGFLDQDDDAGDVNSFDMLRESELHFNAEGTADNGLTYGFHVESEVDGEDSFEVEESYLYLASNLGRVNLGSEDGANYLLQVAAPSADANIDGLRQYISPTQYGVDSLGVSSLNAFDGVGLDYANDISGQEEKITYLSPNWNGLQLGASYTPEVTDGDTVGTAGFSLEDAGLGEAYEAAIRYEGTFNNIGFALGAGYTTVENDTAAQDDIDQWNVAADFDIGAFGIGAVYTQLDNVGGTPDVDADTIVVGADYTTGPFQFGASYLTQDADTVGDSDRYTGGVVYTLTQGLTLRGSVSYLDQDAATGVDQEATSVLGGIQFNF